MDLATSYGITRGELLELGATLRPGQVELAVAALPGWTVHDAYAHLAGGCADVLDGRLDGAGSAAWTAAQCAERADSEFAAVLAEWRTRGPALDEWIRNAPPERSMFLALDAWVHQQDIRATVGLRGIRDDERVPYLAEMSKSVFDRRFREANVPAVRVVAPSGAFVLGDGDPTIVLTVDDYELLRILFGRRSLDQILDAPWTGDPTPVIEHLHLFPLPVEALTD